MKSFPDMCLFVLTILLLSNEVLAVPVPSDRTMHDSHIGNQAVNALAAIRLQDIRGVQYSSPSLIGVNDDSKTFSDTFAPVHKFDLGIIRSFANTVRVYRAKDLTTRFLESAENLGLRVLLSLPSTSGDAYLAVSFASASCLVALFSILPMHAIVQHDIHTRAQILRNIKSFVQRLKGRSSIKAWMLLDPSVSVNSNNITAMVQMKAFLASVIQAIREEDPRRELVLPVFLADMAQAAHVNQLAELNFDGWLINVRGYTPSMVSEKMKEKFSSQMNATRPIIFQVSASAWNWAALNTTNQGQHLQAFFDKLADLMGPIPYGMIVDEYADVWYRAPGCEHNSRAKQVAAAQAYHQVPCVVVPPHADEDAEGLEVSVQSFNGLMQLVDSFEGRHCVLPRPDLLIAARALSGNSSLTAAFQPYFCHPVLLNRIRPVFRASSETREHWILLGLSIASPCICLVWACYKLCKRQKAANNGQGNGATANNRQDIGTTANTSNGGAPVEAVYDNPGDAQFQCKVTILHDDNPTSNHFTVRLSDATNVREGSSVGMISSADWCFALMQSRPSIACAACWNQSTIKCRKQPGSRCNALAMISL